jgi:hypothetical protein
MIPLLSSTAPISNYFPTNTTEEKAVAFYIGLKGYLYEERAFISYEEES